MSDAVSIMGHEDFPGKWLTLMDQLVAKLVLPECTPTPALAAPLPDVSVPSAVLTPLGVEQFRLVNGVLRTAHSLFKRFRFEFRSDNLWTEIKFVLDTFAPVSTALLQVHPYDTCRV